MPFPLVYATLTAWLNDAGLEKSTISTFAWLGFAYALKFLWAPLVDSWSIPGLTQWLGRRRAWLLAAQIGLLVGLFVLSGIDPSNALQVFAYTAFAVAFLSATQDIVLDAYRIEIAPVEMQGVLAAAYQYGYRLAIIVGMAGALYIADFFTWSITYKVMAMCMVVGMFATLIGDEPDIDVQRRDTAGLSYAERSVAWFNDSVVGPLVDVFRRFGSFAILLLAFIALFRISDYVLGILANPFYLDIGFTKSEVATVAKLYGTWVALVGIAGGGWAVIRYGVAKAVVAGTILIASTNLFFAALAKTGASLVMLTVTISADNFAMGFAGTVFIAYLSSLTNIAFTATQYALFSSLSTFFGKLVAGYSGNVQEAIGWVGFFYYAALLGVPAIILSFFVARRAADKNEAT